MTCFQGSKQRVVALAIIDAFNRMDVPGVLSHRAPSAVRVFVPQSMGVEPQDNTVFARSSMQLLSVFTTFHLTLHNLIEDIPARKIVLHLTARGDTKAGVYENEYMWILEFGSPEDGEEQLVVKSTEFVDSVMQRDFWPRLKAAMAVEAENANVSS